MISHIKALGLVCIFIVPVLGLGYIADTHGTAFAADCVAWVCGGGIVYCISYIIANPIKGGKGRSM